MAKVFLDEVSGDYGVKLESGETLTLTLVALISNWAREALVHRRHLQSMPSIPGADYSRTTTGWAKPDEPVIFLWHKQAAAQSAAEAVTEIGSVLSIRL